MAETSAVRDLFDRCVGHQFQECLVGPLPDVPIGEGVRRWYGRGRGNARGTASPAESAHPHLLPHPGGAGPARLHPVAQLLGLVELSEELGASAPAGRVTLLRVLDLARRTRHALGVAPVARPARGLVAPQFPVSHRHITPVLGPYAPTFPPNRWLMPAQSAGRHRYC